MAWAKSLNAAGIIEKLKQKIASLQQQWRRTRREIERLRQENEQLRQERERLRQENERLKRQLEEAQRASKRQAAPFSRGRRKADPQRSEEHTSELQSRLHLACRLLLEKKKLQPQARLRSAL